LNGPNTGTDWMIEGRRTIPLLPRLKARSAFTTLANSLSLATLAANEKRPDKQVIFECSDKQVIFECSENSLQSSNGNYNLFKLCLIIFYLYSFLLIVMNYCFIN